MTTCGSVISVVDDMPVRASALPAARPISRPETTPIDSGKSSRRRKKAGEELSLRSASVLALAAWLVIVGVATAMLEPW